MKKWTHLPKLYKVIQDSVHGPIKINKPSISFLDTSELQRLNNISQLGLAYLVYPGANHKRLEHSFGVAHICEKIASKLELSKFESELLSISGLLHDVGHGPFSHALEYLLRSIGRDHLTTTEKIITGQLKVENIFRRKTIPEILEKQGIDPKDIIGIITGKSKKYRFLSQILNGELDADQFDYLLRDSLYTGVAHGYIDLPRIIETFELYDGRIVINKKGISAVEGMLLSRSLMYSAVYYHHTVRICETMLSRAVEDALSRKELPLEKMVDYELFSELQKMGGYPKEIILRIKYRRLYKPCYYLEFNKLSNEEKVIVKKIAKDQKFRKILEEELGKKISARVIVDVPSRDVFLSEPRLKKTKVKILDKGKLVDLSKYTPLVKALDKRLIPEWAFVVMCDEDYRLKLGKHVEEILFGEIG